MGIAPILTPITAVCFAVVMIGAFVVHFNKHEFKILPMIIGSDVSGVIEAIGKNVTKFNIGDEVFSALDFEIMSGYAEYVTANGLSQTAEAKARKLSKPYFGLNTIT
jgi:NADPH:quinone reductase-like Zn-dependent oxidoreductase